MEWFTSLLQVTCPFCENTLGTSQRACSTCARKLGSLATNPPKILSVGSLSVVACLDYQDWIRELILRQKTHPHKIVIQWMAELIREKMPDNWKKTPCVWIPGHPLQNIHLVEALALALKHLGQPLSYSPFLFRKLKHARAQKELSVTERKNPKRIEKFYTRRFFKKKHNQSVILLDDVMTTGSTLKNCAGLLEKNLSLKVQGAIVLAHTPLRNITD